jgi:TetR/AcrR family acrAB operon transcriptional repressor
MLRCRKGLMVRRTKEQAQATRNTLLDAAEAVFEQRGVSGTSLDEIARAAGVTRGAIYWHFEDKADLFNAMMARATLPLEQKPGADEGAPSLRQLRARLVDVLQQVAADPQMQRVFAIATHKVEYVDEMRAVRERHLRVCGARVHEYERALRAAARRGELAPRVPVRSTAMGLHALVVGLLHTWMLDRDAFDLARVGAQAVDGYLAGLRKDR